MSPSVPAFLTVTLLVALLTHSESAQAAKITKVKDDQVLVDLEGSSDFTQGGRYLMMVDGKKKAVVELSKVSKGKAIGKVLKGKGSVDGTLEPLGGGKGGGGGGGSTKSASKGRKSHSHTGGDSFSDLTVGVVVGLGLSHQDVTALNNAGAKETISMSGNGFSLKGFGDLPISQKLGVIGRFGVEKFGVTGKPQSGGNVKTDIMYVTADLLMRYNLVEGDFKVFPLAGLGLHYPIAKSSDVLLTQQISATTIFFIGGGANFKLSDTMYATATAEYGIFPPSNDVKTSLIAVRGGVGVVF